MFETYLEEVLVPALHPGRVVVMADPFGTQGLPGARDHRRERLRALEPATLLARPQPQEAYAKLKGRLRAAMARSREALIEAMGAALDAITA